MVVPEQYPDILTYPGGEVKCRFVPNIRNITIRRPSDGTEITYQYNIAFPLDSPHLITGTIISATDKSGTQLVLNAELLQFHPGQLHNRGWV